MVTRMQFARNALLNWAALLINVLVPFFLSPFTVHHLGNIVYGVWILVISSVSYFYLLDLGLRNAVSTFVSKSHTLGAHDESHRVVSAAVWLRLGISALVLVLAALVALWFPHVFSIPFELIRTARLALLLSALSIAGVLASGVPAAVLAAVHRYDLLSGVTLFRTAFRTAGIVVLLNKGHGIAALAAWELASTVVMGLAYTAMCVWMLPELRRGLHRPEPEMIRKLWGYSAYAFLITIGGAIINYTDNGVVGLFLSPGAVTFYTIAASLILYSREVISTMSNMFVPVASGFEAEGKTEQLRNLLMRGTQASLLLSLPVSVVLFVRGRTFIGLWMGPQYGLVSGTLLQILLINQVLTVANLTSCGIVYGMAKHRPLAAWALFEACTNLVLSVILVQKIGIYGVAWGTAIAGVICNLVFWPRYVSKLLQLPVRSYLMKAWGYAALAAAPFAAACWYVEHYWQANSLPIFFAQTLVTLPIFIVATVSLFWKKKSPYSLSRLQAIFGTD
jgi:O-antigen/teichoic acid export membrane protein